MKKLLAMLLAISCAITVTSCKKNELPAETVQKKEDKYQTAVWEKYKECSFMELLENGVQAYYGQLFPDLKVVSVSYEKGWKKASRLTEGDASKGANPVTYIVELLHSKDVSGNVYFFMERKGRKVSAVSCHLEIGDESSDAFSKADTETMLEDFIKALEYQNRKESIANDEDEARFVAENFLYAYCEYDYTTAEKYASVVLPPNVTAIYDTVESNKLASVNNANSILKSFNVELETYRTQFNAVYDNIYDKLKENTSYNVTSVTGINGSYSITANLKIPTKESIPDPLYNFDANEYMTSLVAKAIVNGYLDHSGDLKDGVTEQALIDFVASELVNNLSKKVENSIITTTNKTTTITVSWINNEWLVTSFEVQ